MFLEGMNKIYSQSANVASTTFQEGSGVSMFVIRDVALGVWARGS